MCFWPLLHSHHLFWDFACYFVCVCARVGQSRRTRGVRKKYRRLLFAAAAPDFCLQCYFLGQFFSNVCTLGAWTTQLTLGHTNERGKNGPISLWYPPIRFLVRHPAVDLLGNATCNVLLVGKGWQMKKHFFAINVLDWTFFWKGKETKIAIL